MSKSLLFICGSIKASSTNLAVLRTLEDITTSQSFDFTYSTNLELIPAMNPDMVDEPDDASAAFIAEVMSADGVIISSPEYAASIPGVLKNALDWVVGSGDFNHKPVGIVSASLGGGDHVRSDLIRTLTWQGAHVVAHTGITGPKNKVNNQGAIGDAAALVQLEEFFDTFSSVFGLDNDQRMQLVYDVTREQGIDDGNVALLHT